MEPPEGALRHSRWAIVHRLGEAKVTVTLLCELLELLEQFELASAAHTWPSCSYICRSVESSFAAERKTTFQRVACSRHYKSRKEKKKHQIWRGESQSRCEQRLWTECASFCMIIKANEPQDKVT